MLLLLSAVLASDPVCDICNGGLLKPDAIAGGYSLEDNSPYTCQDAQDNAQTAQDTPCYDLQSSESRVLEMATWGQTCCAINPASLTNYSDANASAAEVLAGLQLCFDEGVIADGEGLARLSNPACITAWATLCARDEILGEWMQERVQSRGSRLCNQVPSWARGERLATITSWYNDGTLEMLSYAATQLGVTWFAAWVRVVSDFCTSSLDETIVFQWLWGPWIILPVGTSQRSTTRKGYSRLSLRSTSSASTDSTLRRSQRSPPTDRWTIRPTSWKCRTTTTLVRRSARFPGAVWVGCGRGGGEMEWGRKWEWGRRGEGRGGTAPTLKTSRHRATRGLLIQMGVVGPMIRALRVTRSLSFYLTHPSLPARLQCGKDCGYCTQSTRRQAYRCMNFAGQLPSRAAVRSRYVHVKARTSR